MKDKTKDEDEEEQEAKPEGGDAKPKEAEAKPEGESKPEGGDAKPEGEQAKPEGGDAKPEGGDAKPEGGDTKSEGGDSKQKSGKKGAHGGGGPRKGKGGAHVQSESPSNNDWEVAQKIASDEIASKMNFIVVDGQQVPMDSELVSGSYDEDSMSFVQTNDSGVDEFVDHEDSQLVDTRSFKLSNQALLEMEMRKNA